MADKKISELTALTTAASADAIAIVDDDVGETKKITFANVQESLNIPLNDIADPDGATAISMGSNDIKFTFSNPASDGFNIEAIGAFSGDLVHIHQHTGNPGAVNLVSMHAVDTDVTPLFIENAGGEIFKIDNSGNLTLDGLVDGVDVSKLKANYDTSSSSLTSHLADTSDPHGVNLAQTGITSSGTSSMSKIVVTSDNDASSQSIVRNIVIDTSSASHTASNYTQGTLLMIYS